MDLIYMNSQKEDIGVMADFEMDLAYGSDENNFECKIIRRNHCCQKGFYLYYEGTEYGGIIDDIEINTDDDEIAYSGRTWHGIINSKVLESDSGQDYLIVSGEANNVLSDLVVRMGLSGLYRVSSESSGITISNYQFDRYISGYDGIRKMLMASGSKLNVVFNDGFVELSAKPIVDYSKDEQFDTDQISFKIKKIGNPTNHVICLGKGDLKEREVIHVYTDKSGNISDSKVLTGIDEVTSIYDYANAESTEALKQGGIDLLTAAWNSDELEYSFQSDAESYDVGDIVGAKEDVTGTVVSSDIKKKIIKISNNTTTISYKVGDE